MGLPRESQAELQLPRRVPLRSDLPKRRGTKGSIGTVEQRRVEGIQHFESELRSQAFSHRYGLEKREIPACHPRAAHRDETADIAESKLGRRGERGWVNVVV